MIILRVSMGRGWLKGTVNELNTALEFAQPTTVLDDSQGDSVTICSTEDPASGPGTSAKGSDTSNMMEVGATSGISLV